MSGGRWWPGGGARAVVGTAADALSRPAASAWPLVQATLGATLAWWIALRVAGHPDPFFAPVSAVVALNAPRGERGLQTVRLLCGVLLGIVVAEAAVELLGTTYAGVALASFVAMALAHAAGGARIVVIQAGGSAILTVAVAGGEAGAHRMIDALIGGGVALLFSQVIFSPEPVALLRRAESDALRGIADGLALTAEALEADDAELADEALGALRGVRDRLAELARLRKASRNVARRSAIWRSQMKPLVREWENADHLDLLGSACVMLARTVFAADEPERARLAAGVQALADALAALARTPGDRDTRQTAADRALGVAHSFARLDAPAGSGTALAAAMLRTVATDVMVFAGIDTAQAEAAIRKGDAEVEVPSPPPAPRVPFGLDRWREPRPAPRSARERPHRPADLPDDEPDE